MHIQTECDPKIIIGFPGHKFRLIQLVESKEFMVYHKQSASSVLFAELKQAQNVRGK